MPPLASQEEFKNAVQAYCELYDDIAASNIQLKELKTKLKTVGEMVLAYMKEFEIDACALPDGELLRKQTKRMTTLTIKHLESGLRSSIPVLDDAQLANAINSIQSQRETTITESLTRKKKN
jgi:hypothetical protein